MADKASLLSAGPAIASLVFDDVVAIGIALFTLDIPKTLIKVLLIVLAVALIGAAAGTIAVAMACFIRSKN